ncbi:MAG: iron/manganese transporter [Sphingobacteriia bacterium]|nr:MAG: iron/manganese transporter [Sphingobacteriia bacterium]
MDSKNNSTLSLSEVNASVDTTLGKKGWRRFLAYVGPAYLVSVGYMDPGNWATDLQGGARFGFQLIWVLLMSNLMALLLQSLSARLGIVRRKDLAQANRDAYPPLINFGLYVLAEAAIAACDLAEVLGMAIGIHLLTGLPILWGTVITVLDTFLFLLLQQWGIRKMEAFIISLVAIIGTCFLVQILMAQPPLGAVAQGLVPTALNNEALYIAVGIIGATVMPHNLYLHSALVQTRKIAPDKKSIRQALKFNFIDSTVALNAAFLVNTAILVLAATVFYQNGLTDVAKIEDAHRLLAPMLGNQLAPTLFAIALIAAGQSSTLTGTLAGQIVMEGYLHLRINPLLRRLLTRLIAIVPAVVVILVKGDEAVDDLLVFSQVILSLQLGFAVIPLIYFVSDKKTMGSFAIGRWTQLGAWLIAAILVGLNAKLVGEEAWSFWVSESAAWQKALLLLGLFLFLALFISMCVWPLLQVRKAKRVEEDKQSLHGPAVSLTHLSLPLKKRIAVTLDFTDLDQQAIAHALSQGQGDTVFILIHVVESPSASYLKNALDDSESRIDQSRLEQYVAQLSAMGYTSEAHLGYHQRIQEIIRLVDASRADLLVMGAHRHAGLKDYLFGETIDAVRHRLRIPVLIVND